MGKVGAVNSEERSHPADCDGSRTAGTVCANAAALNSRRGAPRRQRFRRSLVANRLLSTAPPAVDRRAEGQPIFAWPRDCGVSSVVLVGVDPGGRSTGVVARFGDQVVGTALVERSGTEKLPTAVYLTRVVAAVRTFCREARAAGRTPQVAVEGLNPPIPHLGLASPTGVMGAAVVLGAVLATWPGAVVVPPAKHGSAPLETYPPELVGPNESAGTGKRRHLRSAWDVAGAAPLRRRSA
jgi:hypothetical protein